MSINCSILGLWLSGESIKKMLATFTSPFASNSTRAIQRVVPWTGMALLSAMMNLHAGELTQSEERGVTVPPIHTVRESMGSAEREEEDDLRVRFDAERTSKVQERASDLKRILES